MIKWFHKQLKTALTANNDSKTWFKKFVTSFIINKEYNQRGFGMHIFRNDFWNITDISRTILQENYSFTAITFVQDFKQKMNDLVFTNKNTSKKTLHTKGSSQL